MSGPTAGAPGGSQGGAHGPVVRARVIDNPHSFRGPYPLERVLPTFRAAGWEVDRVHRTPTGEARRLVDQALGDGVELLVSAGGDGTLRDLASAVVGTPLVLGILPGGTANVLAHELGIARRPEWAARLLVTGEERRLDLGRLELPDGRWARFALSAGLGLDGAALRATDAGLKRRVGPLAIALGLARSLPGPHRFGLRLLVDGHEAWEGRTWQVLASNASHYAVMLRPSPSALPDDGLLDLVIATAAGFGPLVRLARSLVTGGVPDPAGARGFSGRVFDLELDRPVHGQLDGSPLASAVEGRLRLSIEPSVLRVRLPRVRPA
ncbi:MAG: diacylglycerol/lipid kinase family protein [Candidatus Limnocylindrales bacterium]